MATRQNGRHFADDIFKCIFWNEKSCVFTFHAVLFPRLGSINTLRSRQNGRRFPDDIFKCTFLKENVWISIKISLKFVPKGPIDNIPALVQMMAWRRPGDRPLSETMMARLRTHICVTRPQWVNNKPVLFQLMAYKSQFICVSYEKRMFCVFIIYTIFVHPVTINLLLFGRLYYREPL